MSSFGRSPECTTLARAAYENDGLPTSSLSSLPGCPSNASGVLGPLGDYLPFGLERFGDGHYWQCCGECTLNVPAVRLLYFPDPSLSCNQLNATNSTITAKVSWDSNLPVTAIFSGYTLYAITLFITCSDTYTHIVLPRHCICKSLVQRTSQITAAPSVRNILAFSFHSRQGPYPLILGMCQ